MESYAKPWLSIDDQIALLRSRGLAVPDDDAAAAVLREVGYYRLTGYLYPFRVSRVVTGDDGRSATEVGETYRAGTSFGDAAALLAFDRRLRLLVLEAVERVEVAVRTRLAHTLGRVSPFAHEEEASFARSFLQPRSTDGEVRPSGHEAWSERLRVRQAASEEAFVTHFREKYDGRMPIWVVTELMEFGQVSRLYGGLRNDLATEVAREFSVPTKKLMQSWLASLNYVRNVAAHHARLFNRKLVVAPRRPTVDQVPSLAHLSAEPAPKEFGVYNALAVLAHLLDSIPSNEDWQGRTRRLLRSFPETDHIDVTSTGVLRHWLAEPLWSDRHPDDVSR